MQMSNVSQRSRRTIIALPLTLALSRSLSLASHRSTHTLSPVAPDTIQRTRKASKQATGMCWGKDGCNEHSCWRNLIHTTHHRMKRVDFRIPPAQKLTSRFFCSCCCYCFVVCCLCSRSFVPSFLLARYFLPILLILLRGVYVCGHLLLLLLLLTLPSHMIIFFLLFFS